MQSVIGFLGAFAVVAIWLGLPILLPKLAPPSEGEEFEETGAYK